MDRQEAIKILEQYKKWELRRNDCNSDLQVAIPYSLDDVCKAIDTLIAFIQVTDEMVERGAKEFYDSHNTFLYQHECNKAKAALIAALGGDDV